jgi:hypothetical protein
VKTVPKSVRCAIYTRKSTDQGLEQDFNSLDAQCDASQAYIRSQAHAGWTLLRAMYGRRPRCKKNLTFPRSVRVQPCIRPVFEWRTGPHYDAAAMAAGPDVIR